MPIRIQRQRIKGWKMPPDTVYVGRGGPWGNPYAVTGKGQNSHAMPMTAEDAVSAYRTALQAALKMRPNLLAPLRGKNLACWCKPGEPCHADVLLEIANG